MYVDKYYGFFPFLVWTFFPVFLGLIQASLPPPTHSSRPCSHRLLFSGQEFNSL